jgi:hypothetical protein
MNILDAIANVMRSRGAAPPQQQQPMGLLNSPMAVGGRSDIDMGLPPEGLLAGPLRLLPNQAPPAVGGVRPMVPGESVTNPDRSISNEISITVTHPKLNGGKATVIPTVWLVNGVPRRVSEEQAIEYAAKSGLGFPGHASIDAAEQWITERHKMLDDPRLGTPKPLWQR